MLPGWQFVSREVIMNENNRNEKVSGEIGTNRKSTAKHKGKTVKKIIK